MSILNKLNNFILIFIRKEALIKFQLIIGIFGVVYGILAFFYYFLKVSSIYSLFFLISIIIGFLLVYYTRKDILNGKTKIEVDPY